MKGMRLVAAIAALALAPSVMPAQESGITVGSTAPGADVETLDGKPINLDQYLDQGPVLFQFWATWCSNCKALEPRIKAAVEKYSGKVKVVAVAVSVNQSVERIKAYRDRYHMTHDIVYDRRGWASDAYEVAATSYIVVVNAQRKVVYTGLGADQDIDAAMAKALK
jgi:thiol-disulfide isomerase/thioredoxin